MRLEWIEDLLAVMDTGSLANAAEIRLRTQSAFSRRISALEEYLGNPLFDRSMKPLKPLPVLIAHEAEMRDLVVRLKALEKALDFESIKNKPKMTIVSSHSLATTHSPRLVKQIHDCFDIGVNMQSLNRDKCIMALLSGEAELGVFFQSFEGDNIFNRIDVEVVSIGGDRFIPLATPEIAEKVIDKRNPCPVIAYPRNVFFGQLFNLQIIPDLAKIQSVDVVAESELSHAILQLVLQSMGVGWLPQSLVRDHLAKGELVDLSDRFPKTDLQLVLVRVPRANRPDVDKVWAYLLETLV